MDKSRRKIASIYVALKHTHTHTIVQCCPFSVSQAYCSLWCVCWLRASLALTEWEPQESRECVFPSTTKYLIFSWNCDERWMRGMAIMMVVTQAAPDSLLGLFSYASDTGIPGALRRQGPNWIDPLEVQGGRAQWETLLCHLGRLLGQLGRLETWKISGVHGQAKLLKYWLSSPGPLLGLWGKC